MLLLRKLFFRFFRLFTAGKEKYDWVLFSYNLYVGLVSCNLAKFVYKLWKYFNEFLRVFHVQGHVVCE